MPNVFAMVCEAPADFRTASRLAERVLCEAVDWYDDDLLKGCPLWRGPRSDQPYFLWKEMGRIADELTLRARRQSDDGPDALAARRALLVVEKLIPDHQAILFVRDADAQPERRRGLEGDRDAANRPIVVGLALRMRESWVLSGFPPETPAEAELLEAERRTLGFDPTEKPERLRDVEGKVRCPKRLVASLTQGYTDRERRCLEEQPLDDLRRREATDHDYRLKPVGSGVLWASD